MLHELRPLNLLNENCSIRRTQSVRFSLAVVIIRVVIIRLQNDWPYSSYTTYHTSHDTYYYVKTFLDPDFYYHQATARIWVHTALALSDAVLLPFHTTPFADALDKYVASANSKIKSDLDSHDISLGKC